MIVNLYRDNCTHWVSVVRTDGGKGYYFDSVDAETTPQFLQDYNNLGSDEIKRNSKESFYGAYFLCIIYLNDNACTLRSSLNMLVIPRCCIRT